MSCQQACLDRLTLQRVKERGKERGQEATRALGGPLQAQSTPLTQWERLGSERSGLAHSQPTGCEPSGRQRLAGAFALNLTPRLLGVRSPGAHRWWGCWTADLKLWASGVPWATLPGTLSGSLAPGICRLLHFPICRLVSHLTPSFGILWTLWTLLGTMSFQPSPAWARLLPAFPQSPRLSPGQLRCLVSDTPSAHNPALGEPTMTCAFD